MLKPLAILSSAHSQQLVCVFKADQTKEKYFTINHPNDIPREYSDV